MEADYCSCCGTEKVGDWKNPIWKPIDQRRQLLHVGNTENKNVPVFACTVCDSDPGGKYGVTKLAES